MVGAASLAAARLSVVIGAIPQGFGGVYQDCVALADYSSGTEYGGHLRPCHPNARGSDHEPIYTTAGAGRGRSLHRPGRYRPERRVFRRAGSPVTSLTSTGSCGRSGWKTAKPGKPAASTCFRMPPPLRAIVRSTSTDYQ